MKQLNFKHSIVSVRTATFTLVTDVAGCINTYIAFKCSVLN